jgi:outer membrane protein OmpA-like peptidoglycan-associated protein
LSSNQEKDIHTVFTNLKVNDVIKLDKIYFDQSKYELRPESRDQLEKLYRTIRDNPKLKIEIAGHTDNVGDARLNQYLSENGAQVIYNYLLRKTFPVGVCNITATVRPDRWLLTMPRKTRP